MRLLLEIWRYYQLSCGIHLSAISQEVPMNLILNMCPDIILLKLLPYLPGVNEFGANKLTHCGHWCHMVTQVWVNIGSGNVSSKVFCVIHLRVISQVVPMNWISNMCSDITLKINTTYPRGNDLMQVISAMYTVDHVQWNLT